MLDPEPPQGNCSACLGRNSKRAKCLEQFGKFASFVTSFGAAFEGTELTYSSPPFGSPHLVSAEEKITCHKWWERWSTRLIQMSCHGIQKVAASKWRQTLRGSSHPEVNQLLVIGNNMTNKAPPEQNQLFFLSTYHHISSQKPPLSSDLRVEIFTKDKKNRPGSPTALSTQLQARPAWHRIPLQRPGGKLGFSEWDLHSPKMEMLDYNSNFSISGCVYISLYELWI